MKNWRTQLGRLGEYVRPANGCLNKGIFDLSSKVGMRFRAVLRQVREETQLQAHVHRFRAVDTAKTRAEILDTLSCRSFNRELSVDIPTFVEAN